MQQEGDTVSVPLLTIIDKLGGPEGVQNALFEYAKAGNPLGVQLALQIGADVQGSDEEEGCTPLVWAARSGDGETVKLLIAAGSTIDFENSSWTPLMNAAAFSEKKGPVIALLAAGAKVNAVSYDGWTAIICAGLNACAESKEIMELLLSAGADPNGVQGDGYTALNRAADCGCVESAKALIAGGADVNLGGALHDAAFRGHKTMMELLLTSGANVDTQHDGHTALMKAITSDSNSMQVSAVKIEIIQLLLAHNPDLAARDRDRKTALMLARETKDNAVIQAVEAAYRKKINIPLVVLQEVFAGNLAGIVETPQRPKIETGPTQETPPPP